MSSSEDLQYPRLLLEYRDGFLVSKAMFTACELGVFDLLQVSGAPLSSAAIAERLQSNADGMERLLCTCVGLKLLETEMINMEVLYKNTDLSSMYLTKSTQRSLHPMMMYYSDTMYKYWNYLADGVREGRSQHHRATGRSIKDTFAAVYWSEDSMLKFMQFLNSLCSLCDRDVVTAFDLSPFLKVCDLGGCTGALAREFILAYPRSTVTVYDLPKVVKIAMKHFISPEESQIKFHEGDFLEDPIPEADLYILARVIHDWNDDECLRLLSKVYNSCKPGGGVLVVETLLNADKSGPLEAQLFSLMMLLFTTGTERTPSEYKKLLTTSGFRNIEIRTTGKTYNAILGIK
ncbi:acetylserotonin O-methyltransferase-like [Lissotriton helveticus]